MGKDVMIFYDIFFKSFTIIFVDENGLTNPMHLEYLNDEKNKDNIPETKMRDKFGSIYYVINALDLFGQLKMLIPKEYPGGKISWVVINKAKKVVQ